MTAKKFLRMLEERRTEATFRGPYSDIPKWIRAGVDIDELNDYVDEQLSSVTLADHQSAEDQFFFGLGEKVDGCLESIDRLNWIVSLLDVAPSELTMEIRSSQHLNFVTQMWLQELTTTRNRLLSMIDFVVRECPHTLSPEAEDDAAVEPDETDLLP